MAGVFGWIGLELDRNWIVLDYWAGRLVFQELGLYYACQADVYVVSFEFMDLKQPV